MERTEFINYIFDALYAQPENESLDIACWGMEHLHTEDDSPIYESIIEELLSNEWAVDQGLGFHGSLHAACSSNKITAFVKNNQLSY